MITTANSMQTRGEQALLGGQEIPNSACWGIRSSRARQDFPITGRTVGKSPDLPRSLAQVKKAAALANAWVHALDMRLATAIVHACDSTVTALLAPEKLTQPAQRRDAVAQAV